MGNTKDKKTVGCVSADKDVDFLGSGIPPHKKSSMPVENSGSQKKCDDVPEHIRDAETMTATELREKYKLTASAHRNMKQRKKKGAVIAQEFSKFSDFLRHMGPRLSAEYTLDRIDNSDPEYAPGKVRWGDKHTQNKNKGNNVYISFDGESHTISEWAKITKTAPSTLYKRHSKGWSPEEIITGNRIKKPSNPFAGTPWPEDKQAAWEGRYQKYVLSGNFKCSRIEFLVKVSKQRLRVADKHCDGCDPYYEEEIESAYAEFNKWKSIYDTACRKLEFVNNRNKFSNRRNGSLGFEKEAALYYLINKEK